MDPQISQVRRPANDPGKVQEQCEKKKRLCSTHEYARKTWFCKYAADEENPDEHLHHTADLGRSNPCANIASSC